MKAANKTVELANDLRITIIKESKICTIEIDNPDWNWMMKYIGNGSKNVQIEKKQLLKADEQFFRNLIANTYNKNKQFILEAKLNAFRAY